MQHPTETGFYSNGISTEPVACSYTLAGESVYIYLTQNNNELIIWNLLNVRSGPKEGYSYIFSHGASEALIGSGPIATTLSNAILTESTRTKNQQGRLSKNSLNMILGISVLFIVFGILIYLFLLPWAAERASDLVPIESEIEIGKSLSGVFTDETTTNDSANVYLAQFVQQLKLDTDYPIEVKVIQSDEINAFALPGGRIYIYTGILDKLQSSEELVALLGHEVTHVVQRHSLKSIFRALASGILISAIFGDVSGASSGIISKADEFKQLGYSRELESEADVYGLDLMVKNKVNPKGMLDLLYVLKQENAETPHLMKYLSTHPETEERIEHIRQQNQSKLVFPTNPKRDELFLKMKQSLETNS